VLIALALAAVIQGPPVVLAEGPPRTVVVIADGKAFEVTTVELVRAGAPPVPPTEPPAPDPTEPPAPPETEWYKLGRDVPVIGTVRAKLAAHYSAIGERAARGEWPTVAAMVIAEAPIYLAAIGEDKAITKAPRDAFLAAYQAAWRDGNQTPDKMAKLWSEYGRGLAELPKVVP
jgi:hypothetical protein